MHTIIVGCGRLGSEVARELAGRGDSVAVVDKDPRSFRRLGELPVTTVVGVGFDLDVLRSAGAERADALAAVTSGDNSNIVVARVAREQFDIARVTARIQDPARAEIYHRLGISTVAAVSWTTDQVVRRLRPERAVGEWRDPSGDLVLVEVAAPDSWAGRPPDRVDELAAGRVVGLVRGGRGELVDASTVVQAGDRLYALLRREDADVLDDLREEVGA